MTTDHGRGTSGGCVRCELPAGEPWVAGADGCRGGWCCVGRRLSGGEVHVAVVRRIAELFGRAGEVRVLAIDVPIGLPEAGPRECDRAARRLLGRPRASSVFPVPVRAALGAANRNEASRRTRAADGRGVGVQAWSLFPRIREIDTLLRRRPELRGRIREIHPEVSFAAWAEGRPAVAGKRTREGRAARATLVEAWLGRGLVERARAALPPGAAALDDLLDAFAALWTAERILGGRARTLPPDPPRDRFGLPMEIVY